MIKLFMKNRLLFITFLFIGISTIILIRINSTIFLDQQKAVYDNLSKLLTASSDNLKQDALTFSSAAVSSSDLKEALLNNDQKTILEILNDLSVNINKSFKNDKINLRILTKDTLYCNEQTNNGIRTGYAESFNKILKESQRNNSSIIQTNNTIKVRTPILNNGEIIAFFDVQILFDVFVQTMRPHKIEVIVLFDDKSVPSSLLTEENKVLNGHYFVANDNYNKTLLLELKNLNQTQIQELFTNEYVFVDELFYALYDMKNIQGESLGKFVAIVNKTIFTSLIKEESFLKNIVTINTTSDDFYNFVQHQEENMFLNIEKGYIKNLKDVVDEKDKTEFEEIARQKLLNLSKEELVDFILQQSKHSEIKGQIR